jgi:cardiolipin synthase (CMP-forming)
MTLTYLPNAITLARIALVPVLILALKDQRYDLALALFVLAGLSDALDGFLAKRLNLVTRLGGVLDPAADKILLVSAYVMLTVLGQIPFWLMLTVAFRDLLIVGGYLVYVAHSGPVDMRPSTLSKLNTLMQISLIGMILVEKAGYLSSVGVVDVLIYAVFVTTVASGLHYLWSWGILKDIEPAGAAKGQGSGGRRSGKRMRRQS